MMIKENVLKQKYSKLT